MCYPRVRLGDGRRTRVNSDHFSPVPLSRARRGITERPGNPLQGLVAGRGVDLQKAPRPDPFATDPSRGRVRNPDGILARCGSHDPANHGVVSAAVYVQYVVFTAVHAA